MKKLEPKKGNSRRPSARPVTRGAKPAHAPAAILGFYGILSSEEAGRMIRDIEEAFEQPDGPDGE